MPNNKVIIGMHSNVSGKSDLTDGHSWITVTRNGKTTSYGLWPDDHNKIVALGLSNGNGSDIRVNIEPKDPLFSRYHQLTPKQAVELEKKLQENVEWGYLGNCSNWAGKVFSTTTNQYIDYSDYFFISTPRELGKSIEALEKIDPTSLTSPAPSVDKEKSSSLFSDNKVIDQKIPTNVTGNETVDLLLAHLEKSKDNPNGFNLDVMLATLETKEGKDFTATVNKGVEEMKIAETSLKLELEQNTRSKNKSSEIGIG